MMEMSELVKYYLVAIPIRGNNFNKTSSIVNKDGSIRNGDISTFWSQKFALKTLIKFTVFIVFIIFLVKRFMTFQHK